MEYWLGGVDETYNLVSIGKEDMLKLGRERERCVATYMNELWMTNCHQISN
jgi:hypothetical protein